MWKLTRSFFIFSVRYFRNIEDIVEHNFVQHLHTVEFPCDKGFIIIFYTNSFRFGLVSSFVMFFSHGLIISTVAPTLTLKSQSYGLSMTYVGVVIGLDDVAIFVFSLVLMYFSFYLDFAFLAFIIGLIMSSAAHVGYALVFQVSDASMFFMFSLILRVIQGFGFALSWVSGLPFLMTNYPNREGTISAVAEMAVVLGVVSGPSIATSLESFFHPYMVFVYVGVLSAFGISSFISAFACNGDQEEKEIVVDQVGLYQLIHILLNWRVLGICSLMLIGSTFVGFCETLLTVHFHTELQLDFLTVAFLWSVLAFSYITMVPVCAWMTDKGYLWLSPIAACLLTFALFLMYIPHPLSFLDESMGLTLFYLLISGGSSITCMIPVYTLLSHVIKGLGYQKTTTVISGIINAVFALGGSLGPVAFGGETTTCQTPSRLASHPKVKSIDPQKKFRRILSTPSRSFYNHVWDWFSRKSFDAVHASQAHLMWKKGFTGKGVKIAIFDTGLRSNHAHFKNIIERINLTNEKSKDDYVGHGTFVAGVIAGTHEACKGFAPDAELYIFKVFTTSQVTYTSWFLDAFNYAIHKQINILNLSTGGPDFKDRPFVDKVLQISAYNIIMISAIGNDGPLYGTLNNPADQLDVIGVGGINEKDRIAGFSSRGMTIWELPLGYGRVKPDVVAYGADVSGSSISGRCRSLHGTSVSSPVVAGAVALLLSAFPLRALNPAAVKQALMVSADRLPNAGIFEQGSGKMNIIKAYQMLTFQQPFITLSPPYVDFTECPYMWPYCLQPIYYSEIPQIINVTVVNSMGVSARIDGSAVWHPHLNSPGSEHLRVAFQYSNNGVLWPWSGYVAIFLSVASSGAKFNGTVTGHVSLNIKTFSKERGWVYASSTFHMKVVIIPVPMRRKRILWDQFHNIGYPSGYFPSDNLKLKDTLLDWNGDHIHTNFKSLFNYLRSNGYFIEVLGRPFTCFESKNYGVLMIVDPEEEYFKEEITKLKNDVFEEGLSVIIFADWYNTEVMKKIKFFDENSQSWWTALTGGANVPALNDLLAPFDIQLSDHVYEGTAKVGETKVRITSGTSIAKFPSRGGHILRVDLSDEVQWKVRGKSLTVEGVPVLGLRQSTSASSGRIAVFTDSGCLDDHKRNFLDCFALLKDMLSFAFDDYLSLPLFRQLLTPNLPPVAPPVRVKGSNFAIHSKVISSEIGPKYRSLDSCAIPLWASPSPTNFSNKLPLSELVKIKELENNYITDSSEESYHTRFLVRQAHIKDISEENMGPIFQFAISFSILLFIFGSAYIIKRRRIYRQFRRLVKRSLKIFMPKSPKKSVRVVSHIKTF